MFDEAFSGKREVFPHLLNKHTCCTVKVTIELSVKSLLVISCFWWSEIHVKYLLMDQVYARFSCLKFCTVVY